MRNATLLFLAAASACGGTPFLTAGFGEDAGQRLDADRGGSADAREAGVEAATETGAPEDARDGGDLPETAADSRPGGDAQDGGPDAVCQTGSWSLCDASALAPTQFIVDYGFYPGVCSYAQHTSPIVRNTPDSCLGCAYTCACLQAASVCVFPTSSGLMTTWEGCGVADPKSGMLVVTCQ